MQTTETAVFLNEYDLNEADKLMSAWQEPNPYLRGEQPRPISERLENRIGEVEEGLARLRETLGTDVFTRYIEPLTRITVSNRRALLIAPTEMHRSLLEREFVPQILSAFDVDIVRIVASR